MIFMFGFVAVAEPEVVNQTFQVIGNIVTILGSLAFFIYGMKLMSEGIQKAAGAQLRNILSVMTKNRYLGVFTGFLVTALVQSSSATTVMTVSFVNAGLLTLVESAGVMMGANIGTTITAWLISFLGFKVDLSTYSIPLFAIGLPLLFMSRGRLKFWGEFIIGFAILFLGLSYLKGAVPPLDENASALSWVEQFASAGFFSRLFFVVVGAVITVILQSSSAAMAITLTFVYNGWLPVDVAAAMVLGENLGTTITAEIASLVGNVHAKRSARIHSMFNLIGITWMVILLPFFMGWIEGFVNNFSHFFEGHIKVGEDLSQANQLNAYKIAAFHTFFNLANVLLLLPFVPWLVNVARWSVKSKGGDDDLERLKFISTPIKTPELAISELQKEMTRFARIVSKMPVFVQDLINERKEKKATKLLDKITKYEQITDRFELEITEYITKLANSDMSKSTSKRLRTYVNVCNDLERIGDLFFHLSKILEKKRNDQVYFIPLQRQEINKFFELIDEAFVIMTDNISADDYSKIEIATAHKAERKINDQRDLMKEYNLTELGNPDYNVNSSMVYNSVYSLLEKIGDHIVNVSEELVEYRD